MQNLPDWFPEVWKEEVTVRAQQMTSRVADTIENGGMFMGDTLYMPRVGAIEAVDAARFQELVTNGPALDWIKVQSDPKFLPVRIWDPDKNKLTINTTKVLAKAVVAGIARARDDLVINALNDAALNGVAAVRGRAREAQAAPAVENIVTIGDYATTPDLDVLAEAYAKIGESEVDVDNEQITVLTPFRNKVQFGMDWLNLSNQLKSNLLPWENFTWASSERLKSEDVNGIDIYVYAKSAGATAWNDDVTDINERMGGMLSDLFGQWFQGGAAIKEPKAVVRIKAKKAFAIARGAVKVNNVGN